MVRAGVSYALGRGFDSLLRHSNSSAKPGVDEKVDRKVDRSEDDVSWLTRAIERASAAEQWDVVRLLGGQLEALTRAPNVVGFSTEANRRSRRVQPCAKP